MTTLEKVKQWKGGQGVADRIKTNRQDSKNTCEERWPIPIIKYGTV